MMTYVWVNRAAHAKEIEIVSIPGVDEVCFRSGTVNSCVKGLAVSLKSKIDFFEGILNNIVLKQGFNSGGDDYIQVKARTGGLIFKLRPSHTANLHAGQIEYFEQFDFWDPKIEWHRCPEDLVEGIGYIEKSRVKWAASDENVAGIHIEGHYVGRIDMISCSRFRLRYPSPFGMILLPEGIGQMRSRLKGRKLRRLARYEISEIGPGVIFDFGDLRVWNAEVEPEHDEHANLREFMRRSPTDEIEEEFQECARSARDFIPPIPRLVNLIPIINEAFNFQSANLLKLPESTPNILGMIKRTIDKDLEEIGLTIGEKDIRLDWLIQGNPCQASETIKSHSCRPISFWINLLALKQVVGRKTYLWYEHYGPETKDSGSVYLKDLKDQRGEHLIKIFRIKTGGHENEAHY